jgi:hypothetical protein
MFSIRGGDKKISKQEAANGSQREEKILRLAEAMMQT